LVVVSPNPPVAPVLSGAGVGVTAEGTVAAGCAVALDAGVSVDDPHPTNTTPAVTARRSLRIPDENSPRKPRSWNCGPVDG
jgi:hypothetical protein